VKHYFFILLGILVMITLSGCASKKGLYSWGEYEPQMYQYFNGESPEKLILLLEKDIQTANNDGAKLPPGFYAHLGLLYQSVGRDQDFIVMMELEKASYPESRQYIDHLINNYKR